MKKRTTSFGFVSDWFTKAMESAKKQGRTDSAMLWKDGLDHLNFMNQIVEELKCCGNCRHYREHDCYCFHNWEPRLKCGNTDRKWELQIRSQVP